MSSDDTMTEGSAPESLPGWPYLGPRLMTGLLALLLSLSLPGAARAEEAGLRASLGFAGLAATGRWAPLWISGGGAPPGSRIEVARLDAVGAVRSAEIFPAGGGPTIECPLRDEAGITTVRLRLLDEEGVVAELRMPARDGRFPGHIVLLVQGGPGIRRAIADTLLPLEPVQVAEIGLSSLPAVGLDYDGVSALVLGDPGASLSPAQVEALLGWIAGGGRAVITGKRSGSSSLFTALVARTGEGPRPLEGGGESLELGLGALLDFPSEAAELPGASSPGFWRRTLGLVPYAQSRRLGPSRAFADPSPRWTAPPEDALVSQGISAGLLLWGIAAFAFARRRRETVLPLLAFSALGLGAAVTGGLLADRAHHGGAVGLGRVLLLPGSGSALAWMGVGAEDRNLLGDWTSFVAHDRIAVSALGTEGGSFSAERGEGTTWAHGPGSSFFSTRIAEGRRFEVAALVPVERLGRPELAQLAGRAPLGSSSNLPPPGTASGLAPRSGLLAYLGPDKEVLWWLPSAAGAWERSSDPPGRLVPDRDWLLALHRAYPGFGFLVGREAMPKLGLAVHGGGIAKLCWVLPFPPDSGRAGLGAEGGP